MHAVEVLKGSSQIEYGPHTTGGVINYISTPIPYETEGMLGLSFGNYGALTGHLTYGGVKETEYGSFGALVEAYHEQSDGFRDIQASTNGAFTGSDDTGYEKTDLMLKLSVEPKWDRTNYFEFKFATTDFDANETYLGLNATDLAADPYTRYAASAVDNIVSQQIRTYLRHLIEFDTNTTVTSTLYYNSFERDWYKLDNANIAGSGETDLSVNIMNNPGLLRGETLGDFEIKSNDREYYLYGFQTKLNHSFSTGDLNHDLVLGARIHKDKIDRSQNSNTYEGVYAGDFSGPADYTGPEVEGDREQETVALALFAHDRIEIGDLALSPGLRYEYIEWDYLKRDGADTQASGDYSVFAAGLGFEYQLTDTSKLFGGYHRGFSVPSPGSKAKDFEEEISNTFELGYRFSNNVNFYAEAVGFYTALSDLIVEDNISGSGADDGNVGDVDTIGLELLLGGDLSDTLGTSYNLPQRLAFTYTDATLNGNTSSESATSIFSGGKDGNRVPYVPEFQVSFTTGIEFEKFRSYLSFTYVGERFASASNSADQLDTSGNPDARFGKMDDYLIVDLSAHYAVRSDLEIFAKVTNLFEEEYVSSHIPHGPRTGAARLLSTGFTYKF